MTNPGTHAAVGTGLDVFPPHRISVPDDTLSHEFGVLNQVGSVGDYARHQHPAFGQFHIFPHTIFVLVPHISRLDRVLPGVDLDQQVHDGFKLYVVYEGR